MVAATAAAATHGCKEAQLFVQVMFLLWSRETAKERELFQTEPPSFFFMFI